MPEFCSAAGCQKPDRGLRCLACEAIICAHHAVPVAFDLGNEEDPIIHPLCGRCWDGVRRTARTVQMPESSCRLCTLGAARTERGTHYVDRSGKLVEESCPAVRLASAEAEQALRDAFSVATGHVGCGDSACEFVPRARGMATNGGCRCKHRAFATSALAGLYRAVEQYLQGVAR